jgi:dienelactone hydrolase
LGIGGAGGVFGTGGSSVGSGGSEVGTGGTGPNGRGGSAGAAGVGGSAGSGTTGGASGVGIGGTAGSAGTTGSAGTGVGGAGGGFIRGPAPTVDSASNRGTYTVQTYTSGFRNGPDYADATIHYPTNAEAPFAAVAVVPGYLSLQSSIQTWGPFLASHGIVTMTIGTNSTSDPPATRSRALLDALETLKTENGRSGGQLMGKLDTSRLGLMGWSMGGGGTLISVNAHPELKAAVTLCAWSPGTPFTNNKVPTLLFASLGDPLAGGQSQGFYTSIPQTTPKMLIEVPGGDHYFANNPAGANRQVGRYGLSWMKVFLEGDERYRQFLKTPPTGTTAFQSNL